MYFLFYPRLNPIITNVPLDELSQPCSQVGGRLVREVPVRQAHVSVCERNVAVSRHLYHMFLSLHAQQRFQNRHQIFHRHRRCIAEVVDPQLRRRALLSAASGALFGGVDRSETPFYDVVDVREVTRHRSSIVSFVDVNGFSVENIFGEEKVRHVGSSPGSVYGEESEPLIESP